MNSIKRKFVYTFNIVGVCMIVLLFSGNLVAYASMTGTTSDGLEYSIEDEVVTITGYTVIPENLVIPEEIDGYKVTSIGDYAFSGWIGLTEITIPGSVTSIGEEAFKGCINLKVINLPDGDNIVDNGYMPLFLACPEITINELTYYFDDRGDGKFEIVGYIGKSEQLTIPSRVMGYSIGRIGEHAFKNNVDLKEVELQEGNWLIGEYAFSGCEGLKTIVIPDSMRYIEDYAFYGCKNLIMPNIPDSIISIGDNAFVGCSFMPEGLEYSILDNEVTITGYSGNDNELYIPEKINGYKVTRVGGDYTSFENVTIIHIPQYITHLEFGAMCADNLTEINVSNDNTMYLSKDGVLYSKDGTELIICPRGKSGEFIIPEGVRSINNWAFGGCVFITKIEIPEGVSDIGSGAFAGCRGLTIIEIPEGIISIENEVFSGCDNIKTIIIPSSVTSIDYTAFMDCSRLESICVLNENSMYSSYDGVLYNSSMTCLIRCPEGKSGRLEIPEGVTSIGGRAFEDCVELTCVDMPLSMQYIGGAAFQYCESLLSVGMKEGIISIGGSAFSECKSLEEINIPSSVTSIGDYAFGFCNNLRAINVASDNNYYASHTGILYDKYMITLIMCPAAKSGTYTIPEGVIWIEDRAFSQCYNLTVINVPQSVEGIGDYAFAGSRGVTTINVANDNMIYSSQDGVLYNKNKTKLIVCPSGKMGGYIIPDGVCNIGDFAFYECDKLITVIIPDGVVDIGTHAFVRCTALELVDAPASITTVHILSGYPDSGTWSVFDGCNKLMIMCEESSYMEAYAKRWGLNHTIKTKFLLENYVMTINEDSFIYTGNVIKPIIVVKGVEDGKTVTLIEEVDYIVTCENNKNPGTATITITGIGNYEGTLTLSFKILPKKVTGFTYKSRTASTVTLKWTKNTSADGYVIQQYKGGKWTTIKTITSNSTVNYKVTGLKPSVNYKFRIRAYKNSGNTKLYSTSYTTKSVKTLPSTVKSFTCKSRTASTISLKWTKNTSADGYVIQQYKGGKWTTIKTITKNSTVSYKVTGLKPSTSYKFRIKAYKKDGSSKLYGTYSTKTVKTVPSTVKSFTYKSRTAKTITLKWAKNSSADGYVIQQYKGGKWKTIKTITSKSTVNYKITGLKKNTTYKFRIKAYKKSGSTKLYSTYTTKSIKTAK